MRVLSLGATGRFAGLVVPALVDVGLHVRVLVHDPDKAEQLADAGVTGGGSNLVLTSILGRPPRRLDSFFAELAH